MNFKISLYWKDHGISIGTWRIIRPRHLIHRLHSFISEDKSVYGIFHGLSSHHWYSLLLYVIHRIIAGIGMSGTGYCPDIILSKLNIGRHELHIYLSIILYDFHLCSVTT